MRRADPGYVTARPDLEYAEPTSRRSTLALLALAAAAISALGIVVILIGIALDIEGAREGEEGSVIFPIAWFGFLLGGIAAAILGALAYARGRGRNEQGTKRSGLIALAWVAVALVIFLVASIASD